MKSNIGKQVVPVIPDEGRTFGMDPLFSEFGIFSLGGQKYTPVDHAMLMNYKESESGQILQEGISEAGAMATWTAAATSYAHSGDWIDSVLHILLDVWFPESCRSGLGRCGCSGEGVSDGCNRGADYIEWRGIAASGWSQPSLQHQLCLRSVHGILHTRMSLPQ